MSAAATVETLVGVMDPNHFSFRTTFEKLLAFLDLHIPHGGTVHHLTTRRLKSRPYDVLNAQCPYAAVINRGAHWNQHFNSYLMTVSLETYQLNNMVSFHSIDKNTGYGQMFKLGLKVPPTVAVPQQDYSKLLEGENIKPDLIFDDHEMFDLREIGEHVGFPAFLKPQSGGGWRGVERVENFEEFVEKYNKSGDTPMNLQKAVDYREFVRTMGIGPQMLPMHYNASAKFSHDRYLRGNGRAVEHNFLKPEEHDEASKVCKIINAFYGWHHNTCESLIDKQTGDIHPIDFCNAYPDSSLTSLHFYFPEMVKNMVRWIAFVAVTGRKSGFTFTERWPEFWDVAKRADREGWPYKTRIAELARIADDYFEAPRFRDFCAQHLADLDERAFEFFSSPTFFEIIHDKVYRYFKVPQEREAKHAHYAGIHNFWVHCEKERLSALKTPASRPPVGAAGAGGGPPGQPATPAEVAARRAETKRRVASKKASGRSRATTSVLGRKLARSSPDKKN
ncbi:MAG: hypothetical protein HY719_12770 [Planctomycetes bacterium]|nr:hypothetical protein [Planctomycetota bacterium]